MPNPFCPKIPPASPGKKGLRPAGSPGGKVELVEIVSATDLTVSNEELDGGKGSPGGKGSGGRPR